MIPPCGSHTSLKNFGPTAAKVAAVCRHCSGTRSPEYVRLFPSKSLGKTRSQPAQGRADICFIEVHIQDAEAVLIGKGCLHRFLQIAFRKQQASRIAT